MENKHNTKELTIKSIENTKKRNENKKQKTFVSNKKNIEKLERILSVLHLIALILGILALIDFTIIHAIKHWFEYLTLTIIFIVLILQFTVEILNKTIIKNNLKEIWGLRKINGHRSDVINDNNIIINGKINIEFYNKWNIFNHNIRIEIETKDGEISEWKPEIFILDIKYQTLFIEASSKIDESYWYIKIDYFAKEATWSGRTPLDNTYGIWKWGDKIK